MSSGAHTILGTVDGMRYVDQMDSPSYKSLFCVADSFNNTNLKPYIDAFQQQNFFAGNDSKTYFTQWN